MQNSARNVIKSIGGEQSVLKKEWIARDFVWDVLYRPKTGYFNKSERICSPAKPFNFKEIRDQQEYLEKVDQLYSSSSRWSTPVELFKPFYAQSIANWTLQNVSSPEEGIHVVEMGGGTGTFAVGFLDHLRNMNAEVYSKSSYTVIDASTTMTNLLSKTLEESRHLKQKSVDISFLQGSALDILNSESIPLDREIVVLGNEVLDNMPHDKLVLEDDTFWQIHVLEDEEGILHEEMRPLSDEWIIEYLDCVPRSILLDEYYRLPQPSMFQRVKNLFRPKFEIGVSSLVDPNLKEIFIPTYSHQIMKSIQRFPRHHVVLADFNDLIDASEGINAPCVGSQIEGKAGTRIDFPDYLIPIGAADIFYPTNFNALKASYLSQDSDSQSKAEILSHSQFMRSHSNYAETCTKSGYNPLLEDYSNASFFCASRL